MRPLRLYIENFVCYEHGFIDFTEFSSALIVGKKENNDMYSNGVGKSTIFNAIEYVLFNESNVPLEKLIRDDTDACQVVFDFMIGDQEYRLSRKRTKKGTSDLTLLARNSVDGPLEEVYHTITLGREIPLLGKKKVDKYWQDKSGSRASDTEKDLAKLIKVNYKSFVSTVLFPQNDMTGLPNTTPEKRKGILKEALNLLVYTKLEKLAKEKSNLISKEIEKKKVLLENLGDPAKDLVELTSQFTKAETILAEKVRELAEANAEQQAHADRVAKLTADHSNIESKFASLMAKEASLVAEKSKLETSVKEYQSKKTNVAKAAKDIIKEIDALKKEQIRLAEIDYSQIDVITEQISALKEKVAHHNINIKNRIEYYEELKIPLPSGSICKNCRKPMTEHDRVVHQAHINAEMVACQDSIKESKAALNTLNAEIVKNQQTINSLKLSKQELESINTQIATKTREITDKKSIHEEYVGLLEKFTRELQSKTDELAQVKEELNNASLEEAKSILLQIEEEKKKINTIVDKISLLNKEISHYSSNKAVIQHSIDQKNKDKVRRDELELSLADLETKISVYPSVIQAFSSTGIPNLIIQNVLDDLQIEANNLLSQLKPGLQLSFVVEKTVEKTGDQADTLEILYQINGKERYYKQLSGAMQLAVSFSLKLGLSFLLQKMIGTDIKFLLLDEIDQSLDKASVDAFADIVKFFQKDFNILIITHNDRLKDKFSHAILVEQDINMVSRARVVSSW